MPWTQKKTWNNGSLQFRAFLAKTVSLDHLVREVPLELTVHPDLPDNLE